MDIKKLNEQLQKFIESDDKENNINITEKTIYDPKLILEAHAIEEKWYKSLELTDDEQAPQVMLFIIENNQIKSSRLIQRGLVGEYEPYDNEYYLDRTRDTGDVVTDYNLAPAQKLVNTFNNLW